MRSVLSNYVYAKKVTVLPKLQYCRVTRRLLWDPARRCSGDRGNKPPPPATPTPLQPSSEYEAVLKHFCSFRVPWERHRLTGSGGLRGELTPAPALLPTFCFPDVGETHTPFSYRCRSRGQEKVRIIPISNTITEAITFTHKPDAP